MLPSLLPVLFPVLALGVVLGCREPDRPRDRPSPTLTPDFVVRDHQTHTKFSRRIAPVVRISSGSVIEMFAHEATGGQFNMSSTDPTAVNMDLVHTLTGPVHVEGAEPGDVLAVEILEVSSGDWGWMAIIPQFGALIEDFPATKVMRTFQLDTARGMVDFGEGIRVPLRPFPGVMGVAPDTDDLLDTGPPRANGGNMDNPHLVAGTTVYFPVFVSGALFSIGDPHAAQGLGEVAGTGMESPMRFLLRVSVVKNRPKMQEVQYETATYYATTGFATTLDEAAKKATRYMVEYLVEAKGLSRENAYLLCSLAGDLQIAEVVDAPHMLVAMHLPKSIFGVTR